MHDFFSNLEAIVQEIQDSDSFEIVEYALNPPIEDADLQTIEGVLETSLAKEITDFFKQANGVTLHWRVKPDIKKKALEQLRQRSSDYWIEVPENEDNPFAKINILPLQSSLLNIDWVTELAFPHDQKKPIQLAHQDDTESSFAQRLKPFDLFSNFSCMSFLLEKGIGDPEVLWLTNNYHDWFDSRITKFGSYLRFLIATRGICECRETIYLQSNGHRSPPMIWGQNYPNESDFIPDLFKP